MPELPFEVVSHVTMSQLKLDGETKYIKFTSPIFEAEETSSTPRRVKKDENGNVIPPVTRTMAPPELADVLNLVDNRPYRIIVNTVLGEELRKKYKDDGYVGRCFSITRLTVPGAGKRYATYEIIEIRLKTPAADETHAKSGKGK